jgi:hypothetical protein
MRSPKGFGKNYFSLAAIQAYSSSVCSHAVYTAARMHTRDFGPCTDENEETARDEEIADLLLLEQPEPSSRACHCNCFFRRRTRTVVRRVRSGKRPLSRFRKTKTGISPPTVSPYPMLSDTEKNALGRKP